MTVPVTRERNLEAAIRLLVRDGNRVLAYARCRTYWLSNCHTAGAPNPCDACQAGAQWLDTLSTLHDLDDQEAAA